MNSPTEDSGFSSLFKGALILAGLGGLMAAVFRWHQDKEILLIVLAGALCVGMLLVGLSFIAKWWAKRKAQPFMAKVSGNAAATPKNVAAPGQRAKLDDLRKSFETGIQKYKAAGKDLYTLPWYALVGEPGGGKTEAIRHCQVGFPPGLQDYSQGTGGTINMNWWFTNHAVILDTAGRILFEEVEPGSPSEWKEFLNLLAEGRPNCPINGVILVIPAESLIKDNPNKIEEKAGKIAQQLDLIQRTLAVRFPVFIVITKCDLINGFREFFEGVNDPQLVGQILGWANPAGLDQPFNPEEVDRHLQEIRQSLLRRRLGLLVDPVNTEDPAAGRLDQVDSLYTFPDSLAKIGPKLQFYLQMIFVPGEWAPKPLFLRGIFLTSSMREGSALDQELAEILKVPVDTLPEGRVWERDHSYFLRDVFVRRVFKEKGLVTRVGNTKKLRRRRKAAVLLTGLIAVTSLLGLTFYQSRELNETIRDQQELWQGIADTPSSDKESWAILDTAGGSNKYQNQNVQVGLDNSSSTTPLKISADLKRIGTQPDIPWMYQHWTLPVLGRDIKTDSIVAGRNLFEKNILAPLVKAVRIKLSRQQDWDSQSTDALDQMLQLEAQVPQPKVRWRPELNLDKLFRYVLSPEDYAIFKKKPDEKSDSDQEILQKALTVVYEKDGWPAPWLRGRDDAEHERIESATADALKSYIAYAVRGVDADPSLKAILEVRTSLTGAAPTSNPTDTTAQGVGIKATAKAVISFDAAERAIRASTSQPVTTEDGYGKFGIAWATQLKALETATSRTNEKLKALRTIPGWAKGKTLGELFEQTFEQSRKRAEGEIAKRIEILTAAGTSPGTGAALVDVSKLLNQLNNGLAVIPKKVDAAQLAKLSEVDRRYLSVAEISEEVEPEHLPQFELCLKLYARCADLFVDEKFHGEPQLIDAKERLRASGAGFTKYTESLAPMAGAPGDSDLLRSAAKAVGKVVEDARLHASFRILTAVLASVPKDPVLFANLVASRDPTKKPAFGVSVPMTGVDEKTPFDMKYRTEQAFEVLDAWSGLGIRLDTGNGTPSTSDQAKLICLDQAELLKEYKTNKAPGQYSQICLGYWTKDLPEKLKVVGFDWSHSIKDDSTWTVDGIHQNLQSWCNILQDNVDILSPIILEVIPTEEKPGVTAKLSDLKTRLKLARGDLPVDTVVASKAKAFLAAWNSAGGDAQKAARLICASEAVDQNRELIWTKSGGVVSLVETYWSDLSLLQLKALANEVDPSGPPRAPNDWTRFAKFPLLRRTQDNETPLDPAAVQDAAKWAAAQQKLQSQVQSRPKSNNPEVNPLLARICPGSLATDKMIDDVDKAAKILVAKTTFEILLPGDDERKALVGQGVKPIDWSHIKVVSGDKQVVARFGAEANLGTYFTRTDSLQIVVCEQREQGQMPPIFPPAAKAQKAATFWTCFELLDSARSAKPRGGNLKEWLVEYPVFDTARKVTFPVWLILKFPSEVPKIWEK